MAQFEELSETLFATFFKYSMFQYSGAIHPTANLVFALWG
jgi:hypothetical protein